VELFKSSDQSGTFQIYVNHFSCNSNNHITEFEKTFLKKEVQLILLGFMRFYFLQSTND